MSETTVELSGQNDLFKNLFAGTGPITDKPGSPATDTDITQSGIAEKDAGDISEDIPFHEILGQQIINLTVHDVHNPQKSSHPAIESGAAELIQEGPNDGTDASMAHRTFMSDNQHGNTNDLAMLPASFEGEIDVFPSLTKKREKGFELNSSGLKISDTANSADILTVTFIEHTETAFRNSGLDMSLKSDAIRENGSKNIHTFIPAINQGNFSLSPLPFSESGLTETDVQKNVTFHPHLNLNTPLRRETDSLSGHILLPPDGRWLREDTMLQNTDDLQKMDQSISVTIQEPEFTGSGNVINIRELPAGFKSRAQNISTENRFNVPMPERNDQINATEKHLENDLSKIISKIPPEHNVPGTPQANEEWNLFDNITQKQNFSKFAPPEIHMQETHSGYPFPLDTQITTDGILSNATNFPQNTEVFSFSGATQPSSLDNRKDGVSQMFHRNFTGGIEHTYNIMEQLFQKISMINHGDKSEIRMHLTPPELGSVKIHFTEENDEIEAKIFVENAEVKAAIEGSAHRLKESVAASGVEIHKFEVYIQNNDANKEKSSENPDPGNPHYAPKSQDGRNGGQSGNERNVSNNLQTETGINTSDLTVDYII